jgi:capsular polysaccharide transport system permease protein
MLFSGVFFIVDFVKPDVRYVLSWNPMMHAIALFRMGFYPNYPRLVFDRQYMWVCALVAVVFGLVIERLTRRGETR